MEKGSPHVKLDRVKALVKAGKVQATRSAYDGAARLGFDEPGMFSIVENLTIKDFYKSMTTQSDHRIWQDVYRPITPTGIVYLKLTVIDDLLIVSFKEL